MSKQRKFNALPFFNGFHTHEFELAALFSAYGHAVPDPLTPESFCKAAIAELSPLAPLSALLYQLNDLATRKGREIIEKAAASFSIPGGVPGTDVTHQRAALWLRNADQDAFDHAMDRLAASGVQGGQLALFPGNSARPIEDPVAAVAGFEDQLNKNIKGWNGAERFTVHHYIEGTMLTILVFCEHTAEAMMEMDRATRAVKTRIGRRVIQDVLFYDQGTGELEIEASHPKQREVLRNSFAEGVLGDDSFFPMEQSTRVLDLQKLIGMDFKLPVRTDLGHQVQITGVTLKGFVARKSFTSDFTANRHDVIAVLRTKKAEGLFEKATIQKVRVELILGPGRLDRKSIELSGDNRIKFNRASHADEVYQYLRHWTLMGNR